MNNSVVIGDLLKEVGNMQSVDGRFLKFEKYTIDVIEGEKFIVGETIKKDSVFTEVSFDGPNLLFSLVNLIEGALPKKWDPDKIISDKDVLKWCEEHGIPYRDKVLNQKLEDGLIRGELLHLRSFKHQVLWLIEWFSVWKALLFEETDKLEDFNLQLKTFIKYKKLMIQQTNNTCSQLELIKDALAEMISNKININVNIQFNKTTGGFNFVLVTTSLIDVAYFQLAALMTKIPSESKEKLTLCKMPNCNNLFWASHGNEKFCNKSKCNPKNYWYYKNKKAARD